jgi:hypothetical protein
MAYRGPNAARMGAQFAAILANNGETGIWRQWVSAGPSTGSAVWAGMGESAYYQERWITACWAAPQMGESRFRETQLPAGQVVAGDAVVSLSERLGLRDELIWRGVTYRVEGDSTPIHLAGYVWYRTVLRRGDVTG